MSIFSKILNIMTKASNYSAMAAHAVQQVETEIGPGNGATKKQLAVSYILAAAHAGESVPVPQVQAIAAAVELAAGIANALGIFGKPNPTPVAVPADTTQ